MDIRLPHLLYHGTTYNCLGGFRKRLLDRTYWKPGRDFGEGLYTTTSLAQAQKWAHKVAEASASPVPVNPCILFIQILSVPEHWRPLIFTSGSREWAAFIFSHRLVLSKSDPDPCEAHPDLVMGPMADNDTGKIMRNAVQWRKDVDWFYDQITRSRSGRKLDDAKLGNQVVFCSPAWEHCLRLKGHSIYRGGRWKYDDSASQAESV